jgi:predicted enzyme related to lactoylglutathione lyase
MPERTSYDPGTPSWVDLSTSDPDGAKRFYGELFGWDAEDAGPVEETGGYGFFTLRGRKVTGIGPLMAEGQPVAWSVYVSTDDIEAMATRARQSGGMVVAEPMDVMDAGRLAFFVHPAAGAIGAWQPGRHIGAEIVNEPGAFTWSELQTRDLEGATGFCEAVFGWTAEEQDFGGAPYVIFKLGDTGIAGMAPIPEDAPEEASAGWLVYFAVEDCDAAVAKVEEAGGSVSMPPTTAEGVGRFSVVADPQGARFGVIANA